MAMAAFSPSISLFMSAWLPTLLLADSICRLAFATTATGGRIPAMFVFGDSLMDPGNNNNLLTLAKANFPPNGIDFPQGVTGRYCNGGTFSDHLATFLGLPLVSPFNNPNTTAACKEILSGVNFASAASGILNETGKLFGKLFSMEEQIHNFIAIKAELSRQLGDDEVDSFLAKSLFLVSTGNNDYINNYLLPFSRRSRKYTPEAFRNLLVDNYAQQLKKLYELGARKVMVVGLGPLGCIPSQIGNSGGSHGNSCVDRTNRFAAHFNSKLKSALHDLNAGLPGPAFFYFDGYTATMEIINNYASYGFKYAHRACCGAGRSKGQILCLPLLQCQNRREYVFWDPFHPTDAFNAIVAQQAFQQLQQYL